MAARYQLNVPGIQNINTIETRLDESVDVMGLIHSTFEKEVQNGSPSGKSRLLHFVSAEPYKYPMTDLRKTDISGWYEARLKNDRGLLINSIQSLPSKHVKYQDFHRKCTQQPDLNIPTSKLELQELWRTMTKKKLPYKVDLQLNDKDNRVSLLDLDNPLSLMAHRYGQSLTGIQTTYLLLGAAATGSPSHYEDRGFGSLNKMKAGLSLWLTIDFEDNEKLHTKLSEHLGIDCRHLLKSKNFIIPPDLLNKWGIKYYITLQQPGDVITTMPGCIHTVINFVFTIKEALNFLPCNWIEPIIDFQDCHCTLTRELPKNLGSARGLEHGQSLNDLIKNSMILECIKDWRALRESRGGSLMGMLDPSTFQHITTHGKKIKAQARKFDSMSEYTLANRDMDSIFKCVVCEEDHIDIPHFQFKSYDVFRRHVAAFHVDLDAKKVCKTCLEKFGSNSCYISHRRNNHSESPIKPKKSKK